MPLTSIGITGSDRLKTVLEMPVSAMTYTGFTVVLVVVTCIQFEYYKHMEFRKRGL